jgi:simple sugar transport system ATP-binding protein
MIGHSKSGHVWKEDEPLFELRGITKAFPNVLANDHIDLNIWKGEIHALLGENGAGKSTLSKILYGFYQLDSGEIRFLNKTVHFHSPQDARKLHIGMVFQNFTLIPAMTVIENIALFLPDLGMVLDRKQIIKKIDSLSQRFHLEVEPLAPVWQLSIGEQQKVEVLKLLLANVRLLILDEPTRVLAPHEIAGLFKVMRGLKEEGYAVIFITHKIKEVLECADRITVMRHGRVTGQLMRSEASEDKIIEMMFGKTKIKQVERIVKAGTNSSKPLLEIKKVSTKAQGFSVGLKDIDLKIFHGEIVGVAGVSGNGQKELGDFILGLLKCEEGHKFLFGKNATHWHISRVRREGAAFIPENPLSMAAVPNMTSQENMAVNNTRRYSRRHGFFIDLNTALTDLERSFENLGMTAPPFICPIKTLSGGNIQRVIIARELAQSAELIVAFYPTKGLDVLSTTAIRQVLMRFRDSGCGIILISDDLEELFSMSDRLIVLYQGKIVGHFKPEETNMVDIGHLMTGARG